MVSGGPKANVVLAVVSSPAGGGGQSALLVLQSGLANSYSASDLSIVVEAVFRGPQKDFWGSPPQTDLEIPSGVLGTIAIRSASKNPALELHFQLRSCSVDPFRGENVNHRRIPRGCISCPSTVGGLDNDRFHLVVCVCMCCLWSSLDNHSHITKVPNQLQTQISPQG